MVVLLLYVLVLLGCWWAWLRAAPRRGAARTTRPVGSAPRAAPAVPRPPCGRAARHREVGAPPLDEDDVIAFGLALEGTEDVVRWAVAGRGRPPAPSRVSPDTGGRP